MQFQILDFDFAIEQEEQQAAHSVVGLLGWKRLFLQNLQQRVLFVVDLFLDAVLGYRYVAVTARGAAATGQTLRGARAPGTAAPNRTTGRAEGAAFSHALLCNRQRGRTGNFTRS